MNIPRVVATIELIVCIDFIVATISQSELQGELSNWEQIRIIRKIKNF